MKIKKIFLLTGKESFNKLNIMSKIKKTWYRLDNAAKIYPSIESKRTTTVFRISSTLKEPVNDTRLQQALEQTIKLFPIFKVRLKKGLFWHYLEENNKTPIIAMETNAPCRQIKAKENNGFLFRVLYYKNKISVEFSHILTDGTGALIFLQNLLNYYLAAKPYSSIKNLKNSTEDSYIKNYKKNIPFPDKKAKAYHIKDRLLEEEEYRLTTGIVDVNEIKKTVKEYNCSITEFLTSLYIFAIQEELFSLPKNKLKKLINPIRILVPVNLRKIYESTSVRNFFLTVTPGIDPRLGKYSLDEIIKIVYHYMRVEVDEKYINQQIARNVASEKNTFIRLIPLFLKVPFEKFIYKKMSSALHSGLLTNLGIINIDENISKEIERFEFLPNPNQFIKINCGIISFKESLYITFASLVENTEIQRIFFSKLRELDINIKIETNF